MDFANVVGECGQEQRAVADAFGTGQGNGRGLECGSGQANGFGHWLGFQIVDKTILYAGKGRLKNEEGAIYLLKNEFLYRYTIFQSFILKFYAPVLCLPL